jgi:ankyrin repeat protein
MASQRRPHIRRLIVAITSGDIKLVEHLVAEGVNVNGKHWDDWRSTPSSCAIRKNHTEILALLIRNGLRLQRGEDGPFLQAAFYQKQDSLKLLSRAVFAPDLWRGKSRAEIEGEADLIYRNIQASYRPWRDRDESFRIARLELFDAAMTCWEQVRPDPPKIKISDIPAKGRAL